VQRLRADLLTARGRLAEAAALYRDVLATKPADNAALTVVLSDCRQRGNVEDAIGFATRALTEDSDNFIALHTLGWAYVTQGNHPAARSVVERALKTFNEQKLSGSSTVLRAIGGALGLLTAVPGLTRWFPRVSSMAHVDAETTQALAEWKSWAQRYLEWQQRGSGQAFPKVP
jgi:tetratricopeptide (TPR) repeat protein